METIKSNFPVVFCTKCVLSNQKPITLIESRHQKNSIKDTVKFTQGVCDACKWNEEKNLINWKQRDEELKALCDEHRRIDGGYDVIVPASGGKDSRYVAHLLKFKYNMNPLTVTWRPHIPTEVGIRNLSSMIDSGFDNQLISPNGDIQKKLTRLAFENLGHPFQPFILGQRVVGPKAALATGAKLVFYGENVAEYGNRIEENYTPTMNSKLYTSFNFLSPKNKFSDFFLAGVNLEELVDNKTLRAQDLAIYASPDIEQIEENFIEVHYMSYYKKWVPQDNYYYAVQHTGFEPNPSRRDGSYGKYAGIDDMIEDLHYFMQLVKFGMGRATWDACQEIRTEKITREEGASLVRKYDTEAPKTYIFEILNYLQMTETEFWAVIDSYREGHLWDWEKEKGWFLKNQVR